MSETVIRNDRLAGGRVKSLDGSTLGTVLEVWTSGVVVVKWDGEGIGFYDRLEFHELEADEELIT